MGDDVAVAFQLLTGHPFPFDRIIVDSSLIPHNGFVEKVKQHKWLCYI